jgi:ferric enterobactin receptor
MKCGFFLWVLCTVLMGSATLYAQQPLGKISGQIKDEKGRNLELVTVSVFRSKDTAALKTLFTDSAGRFVFAELAPGTYFLSCSLIGYAPFKGKEISITAGDNPQPPIVFQLLGRSIEGVVVNAKKPLVERKADRTIVNVDAIISAAGSTAMDVLAKSPGVIVDQDGNISLNGKPGVIVFIDDKPTYLDAAGLDNYLRTLPASVIDQIEIMTNPPAKYDAAGGAGIINIKTKKTKIRGFNGGFNLGVNQGVLTRSNNSFNFNYRKNKVNIFGNMSLNYRNRFQDLTIERDYQNANGTPKSLFDQSIYNKLKGPAANFKTGLDYYKNERTTMGFVITGAGWNADNDDDNVSIFSDPDGKPYSMVNAFNASERSMRNLGVNLNYKHQFSRGQEISVDADYVLYKTSREDRFNNAVFNGNNPTPFKDLLTGSLPATINIYALKADYSRVLGKGYQVTAGAKSSYITTDNDADYFYTANNITVPDYDKSNTFLYKENINAVYASVNKDFKRLSLSAGLRLENTVIQGDQLGNPVRSDSTFRYTYTSLFPTLYLSYSVDTLGKHRLGLNYGRRVDRPFYQDLNPFIAPFDKFTFYVGNPFLRPSFTNSIELSYLYNNKLSVVYSYNSAKNQVNETIEIRDSLYFSRPGNIGSVVIQSLSVNYGVQPTKWLVLNLNASGIHVASKTDFYTGPLNTSGFFLQTSPLIQFLISPTWSAELSGAYTGRIVTNQFVIVPNKNLNIAFQKRLPKNWTAKLSFNDIFYSVVNGGTINNLALTNARFRNIGDSRNIAFSLSYRFGKAIANLRKHDATSADQEKNRVKN